MKRISYLVSIVFLFSLLILLPTKAEGIDDHLHYSINLVWDIADESQKYHQSVDVVNMSSKLYPKYNFSIQTSSVDYEPEDMEFILPLSLFTKRDLTELGITEKYKEDKIFPIEIAINSENKDDWYYIKDKENDKLIIKNKNTIYAGTNAVFQVKYDLESHYKVIYDMSIGRIQAIGKCKPTSETPGVELPVEELVSNEITYQIDTGLSELKFNKKGYGDYCKFEPYDKLNGYRYYKVTLAIDAYSLQPFDFAFSFDFKDTNGEIVGPEENVSKNIVITDIDNYKPVVPKFEYHTRTATSLTEGISSNLELTEFYVRYKDDSSNEDKLDIKLTATCIDNDGYNHISPDDNDILSTDISFSHQWVSYPNKPIGEIMKGPTEPNITDRLSAMLPTDSSYEKLRMFFAADKAVIGRSENDNSKLIITDTGIIPDDNAPIIDYELIYLLIDFNNIGIYNNITGTITPINTNAINERFSSIAIDFSKDGNIWDENITIDLEKDITNYGHYEINIDKLYDKGYKNFRITFDGIKENTILNDRFVEFNIRVTEYTKEYLERQDLDTYTNWAEFELYSDGKQDYLVKDWSKFTLTPTDKYHNSDIRKQILGIYNHIDEQNVSVNFRIYSNVQFASIMSVQNVEQVEIISHHIQKVKNLYDKQLIITSSDKAIFYDLLPPGYTFNTTHNYSITIDDLYVTNKLNSEGFSVEMVDNYLNTGRTLVIFKLDISKINLDEIILDNIVTFSWDIYYQANISWKDLVYYQNERNFVAFQMESGIELPNGYPDDGNPYKSNQNSPGFSGLMTDSGKLAFYDINGDGDTTTPNTLYAQVIVSPNVTMASQSGISKHIMGDSGKWTDLDITDINKEYKYRVRVSTSQTTTLSDLIVFDTLEEAANTNEWEGEVPWKGTFKSVDTSWLIRHGFDPVVYYSTATVDKLDYNIITGRENNPWINDTTIWSTEKPTDLSKVTAIAVDCRKMKDGSDAKLENGRGIEFEIKMTAPSEYPTSKNPKMIYAYNRPAYSCKITPAYSATPEYYTDIGHRVRIYLPTKISVNVKKTWVGEDNLKPREITVKLLANGVDTGKTITLSELNNWTNTFENLDDIINDEKIIYTIEEIEVPGYRTEITGDAETGFEIINTQLPKEGWLKIKKTVAPQYEGLINKTNP